MVENKRFSLRVNSFPNFIIKIEISVPSIETTLCQALIQLNRRAFDLNFMRSDHLVNLIFRNTVIPNFRIVFAQYNDKPVLLEALLQDRNDLLSSFKRREVFLSDSPAKNCLHECFAVGGHRFVVAIKFCDSFFEEHGVNLFSSYRTCKHWHLVKNRHVIVNDHILDFTVFVKAKFINSVRTETFSENLLELLRMGSGDENKSVLEFLIGAVEFFKAFWGVFLRVDSIIDNFGDSGPLDFFLIMFMCD